MAVSGEQSGTGAAWTPPSLSPAPQPPRRRGEPSAAFRLLAACCRWPTDAAAVRAAATAGIDWPYLMALANRHRVNGFLWRGLTAAGIEPPPLLAMVRKRIVTGNLRLHAESVRIAQALDAAGIAHVFLKGSVVAQLAYRDHGIKHMIDNDLLVAPRDARAALTVLEAAGYAMTAPPRPPDARLDLLFRFARECQLVDPARGTVLDLHWQLHVHRHLLPEPDVARDRTVVSVAGRPLSALRGEQMMLHLLLHGARHRWSRLKWIADFNALVVAMAPSDLAALRDSARRYGIGAVLDSTLALCARRFGTVVPDDVLRTRRARWLVALCERLIFGRDELADQQDMPARFMVAGTASAFLFKLSPRYWLGAARDMLVSPGDVLAVPLPRALYPLYGVVAPGVRITRRVRATAVRPRAAREK